MTVFQSICDSLPLLRGLDAVIDATRVASNAIDLATRLASTAKSIASRASLQHEDAAADLQELGRA